MQVLTSNQGYPPCLDNAAQGFEGEVKTGVCIRTLAAGACPKLSLARSPPSDKIAGSQGLMPTKAPW